jgi:transposase
MTTRQLSLGRYRLIAALMALGAASLAVASALHLAGLVHGRGPSVSATWAGAAEAVIGLVLLAGAITLARRGTEGRPAALAATGAVDTIPRGSGLRRCHPVREPLMPLLAVLVTVTAAEHKVMKKRIRGTRTAWRDRLRAKIVLAAATGHCTARIARDLRISQDTARKWRGRFADRGLEGLGDLPRPARPRQIGAEARAAVVALACQLPAVTGVPLAHWTGPELAAELAARGLASPMSASSVLRILAEHPVPPACISAMLISSPLRKWPVARGPRR